MVERSAFKHFRSILPASSKSPNAATPSPVVAPAAASGSPFAASSNVSIASYGQSSPSFTPPGALHLPPQPAAARLELTDLKREPGLFAESSTSAAPPPTSLLQKKFPLLAAESKPHSTALTVHDPAAASQPVDLCIVKEDGDLSVDVQPASKEFVDIDDLASLARLKANVELSSDVGAHQLLPTRPSETSPALTQLMSKLGEMSSDRTGAVATGVKPIVTTTLTIVPPTPKTSLVGGPKPFPRTVDKRERDDSWKKYLTRFVF
jgi:hypothetical protein